MLTQPTIEKLNTMKLTAMAKAFQTQMQCPEIAQLSFEERFGLIVDYQMTDLENRRMQNRLKTAKRQLASETRKRWRRSRLVSDRGIALSLPVWLGRRGRHFGADLIEVRCTPYGLRAISARATGGPPPFQGCT